MIRRARRIVTKDELPELEAKAWEIVQRIGVFGHAELAVELSVSPRHIPPMVRKWLEEGRVQIKVHQAKGQRARFEPTFEYREPKDRISQVAHQLWTAMRGLKKFTPTDLAAHCREDLRVTVPEASAYAQALLRGEYLRVLQRAAPDQKREATYQLLKNTGPRAPCEKRVVALWDPNEGVFSYVTGVGRMERAK